MGVDIEKAPISLELTVVAEVSLKPRFIDIKLILQIYRNLV